MELSNQQSNTTLLATARHWRRETSNPGICKWQKRLDTLAKKFELYIWVKSRIAQAGLSKVRRDRQITSDNDQSLREYYYSESDCLITLKQLGYELDWMEGSNDRRSQVHATKTGKNQMRSNCDIRNDSFAKVDIGFINLRGIKN